ncbi:hypothetical protein [Paraburkholderia sp. 40]
MDREQIAIDGVPGIQRVDMKVRPATLKAAYPVSEKCAAFASHVPTVYR